MEQDVILCRVHENRRETFQSESEVCIWFMGYSVEGKVIGSYCTLSNLFLFTNMEY